MKPRQGDLSRNPDNHNRAVRRAIPIIPVVEDRTWTSHPVVEACISKEACSSRVLASKPVADGLPLNK